MRGHVVNQQGRDVWMEARHEARDDTLAARARLGDQEAFAVLYQRYKLDVWHLAWFTLRDHHDAEDVLQETFLKAQRGLRQYRGGETLRPWLLTICRNACRDRMRSAHRHETLALDEEAAGLTLPAADPDRHIDLHRALARLPEEDREAFLLVDVLGCRSDEAAKIAGLRAPSTLRSRLARARRELLPALAEPTEAAGAAGDQVWGLYHSPNQSAIVLCPGSGVETGPTVDGLLGRLRDGQQDSHPPGNGAGLVDFLESLEDRIPGGQPVLAVVDERPAGAAPWLAGHPRWHMQRAPTHASWLGEVEALLGRCAHCSAQDRDRLRDVLSESATFVWTGGP